MRTQGQALQRARGGLVLPSNLAGKRLWNQVVESQRWWGDLTVPSTTLFQSGGESSNTVEQKETALSSKLKYSDAFEEQLWGQLPTDILSGAPPALAGSHCPGQMSPTGLMPLICFLPCHCCRGFFTLPLRPQPCLEIESLEKNNNQCLEKALIQKWVHAWKFLECNGDSPREMAGVLLGRKIKLLG